MTMSALVLGEKYPIQCHAPEDVFVVAYPKSGITWFQHLLSGILYGINPAATRFGEINNMVPDVHYKKEYLRRSSPMVFKSHNTPLPEYKRVLYLFRDGRDVTVSFYHHYAQKFKNDVTYDKIINGFYCSNVPWAEHVEMWKENPYDASIMYISYESLLTNPLPVLQNVANFLERTINDKKLEKIIERSSFENLKRKEMRWGLDNPAWKSRIFFLEKVKWKITKRNCRKIF